MRVGAFALMSRRPMTSRARPTLRRSELRMRRAFAPVAGILNRVIMILFTRARKVKGIQKVSCKIVGFRGIRIGFKKKYYCYTDSSIDDKVIKVQVTMG